MNLNTFWVEIHTKNHYLTNTLEQKMKNKKFSFFEFPNHNPHFTALWLARIRQVNLSPSNLCCNRATYQTYRKIEDLKTVWHSTLTYLTRTSSLVSCFFHTVASEGSRGLSLFASLVTLSHRAYREDFYPPHTYETWKARRATHRVFHSKLDYLNCL